MNMSDFTALAVCMIILILGVMFPIETAAVCMSLWAVNSMVKDR